VQLLFQRLDVEDGKYVGSREDRGVDRVCSGSVLIMDRKKHVVEEEVRSMCRLIKDLEVTLMTEVRNRYTADS
jgi:hypothetical protein